MPKTRKVMKNEQGDIKSLDDYLDEALEETFPASDPVAISKPDKKESLNSRRRKDVRKDD